MRIVDTKLDLIYDTVTFTISCEDTDDVVNILSWCRSNLGEEYKIWTLNCMDNYLLFNLYIFGLENGLYFRLCQ